jgi:DegV family protein with EDD domain
MTRVAIITDSLASLPDELVSQYDIGVAPQILIWGEETLLDGIDITAEQFYIRLANDPVMPKTSQVTVGTFADMFRPLVEKGIPIVAVLLSSKLSGTVDSAQQAKAMFPDAKIAVIDSLSASMALGYQVLAAARSAAAGKSFEEVSAVAKRAVDSTGVVFAVDTLEFLHRGGRIGGAAKLLGTALNLKPVLELREGRVESVEKVRTKGKANARVIELVAERIAGRGNIRLATLHANAEEEARTMLAEAVKKIDAIETHFSVVSPVLGTHAGPGTVGLAYSVEL